MSHPSKIKGTRVENEIVQMHHENGFKARRIPMSGSLVGAFGEDFAGDLRVLDDLKGEVKARKNGAGFVTLEKWLGDNKLIFLKRNRQKPMVAMPWDTYVHLVQLAAESVRYIPSEPAKETPPPV